MILFAAIAIAWTWPLVWHLEDALAGGPGDNFSFVWNLWWMRHFVETPGVDFFHTSYLFSPFGTNIANHPHTALPAFIGATLLRGWSPVGAQNLLLIGYIFANMAVMYALAWALTRHRLGAVIAAVVFGVSPYVSVHLLGHFDLIAAWVLPLYALSLRRSVESSSRGWSIATGACLAVSAYVAYYYVAYLLFFTLVYVAAAARMVTVSCARTNLSRPVRLFAVAAGTVAVLSAIMAVLIIPSGGGAWSVGSIRISARTPQNALSLMWLGVAAGAVAVWRPRFRLHLHAETFKAFWLLVRIAITFSILVSPLLWQSALLFIEGDYITPVYQWRSSPRGVDLLAPMLGHPLHPALGSISQRAYSALGQDYIEAIGWFGLTPLALLLLTRWSTTTAAILRPWTAVGIAFGVWALGPLLTIGGFDTGLRLPAILLRFVPVVANARMPGRAIVIVFMVVAVLLALTISTARGRLRSLPLQCLLLALILFEYWSAPIPLTMLDRPAVYEALARADPGAVCEVPFGIGDGLSAGVGSQDRRVLWYATLHQHPMVGGYIGRMPADAVERYRRTPVVGTLLMLSAGQEPALLTDTDVASSPCRYLVVHRAASPARLLSYVNSLAIGPIFTAGGDELYRLY